MLLEIGGIAITSAFFAGILMFLAPCTLPLVPAYLGFISGVSNKELVDKNTASKARKKIFINGVFFILGFSIIFILLGTFAGILGAKIAGFQLWSRRVGGILLIFFGLFMLGVFNINFLQREHRFKFPSFLTIGKPSSSFLVGSSFAVGWTPCVGPILAGILALATQSSTVSSGAFLLTIFSLGLAIPFLLVAFFFSKATAWIAKITKYSKYIEIVGGIFLIFLGVLLLTNNFVLLIQYGYKWFSFLNYDSLLNYL